MGEKNKKELKIVSSSLPFSTAFSPGRSFSVCWPSKLAGLFAKDATVNNGELGNGFFHGPGRGGEKKRSQTDVC